MCFGVATALVEAVRHRAHTDGCASRRPSAAHAGVPFDDSKPLSAASRSMRVWSSRQKGSSVIRSVGRWMIRRVSVRRNGTRCYRDVRRSSAQAGCIEVFGALSRFIKQAPRTMSCLTTQWVPEGTCQCRIKDDGRPQRGSGTPGSGGKWRRIPDPRRHARTGVDRGPFRHGQRPAGRRDRGRAGAGHFTGTDWRSAATTTNERGQLRFPSLPPGAYVLEIELQGFGHYREADIRLGGGATIERTPILTRPA